MRITYLSEVREPPDQVGVPGETRDISDYLGEKLVTAGYAIVATDEKSPDRKQRKEKTDAQDHP